MGRKLPIILVIFVTFCFARNVRQKTIALDSVGLLLKNNVVYYSKPIVLSSSEEAVHASMFKGASSQQFSNAKEIITIITREYPYIAIKNNLSLKPLEDELQKSLNQYFFNDTTECNALPAFMLGALKQKDVKYLLLLYNVVYKFESMSYTNELSFSSSSFTGFGGFSFRDTEFFARVTLIDVQNNTVVRKFPLVSDNDDLDFGEELMKELFEELGLEIDY